MTAIRARRPLNAALRYKDLGDLNATDLDHNPHADGTGRVYVWQIQAFIGGGRACLVAVRCIGL